jgi:hypothetical protein
VGFGPLTRSTLLRLGYRDICRDLDLHEGTSVRFVLGAGRVVRTHLAYDGNALVFRTPTDSVDPELEEALVQAFPGTDLRRIVPANPAASGGCQVRFPLPLELSELREQMEVIRRGLLRLLARFEPARYAQVREVMSTFGDRATLERLRDRSGAPTTRKVVVASAAGGTVH